MHRHEHAESCLIESGRTGTTCPGNATDLAHLPGKGEKDRESPASTSSSFAPRMQNSKIRDFENRLRKALSLPETHAALDAVSFTNRRMCRGGADRSTSSKDGRDGIVTFRPNGVTRVNHGKRRMSQNSQDLKKSKLITYKVDGDDIVSLIQWCVQRR